MKNREQSTINNQQPTENKMNLPNLPQPRYLNSPPVPMPQATPSRDLPPAPDDEPFTPSPTVSPVRGPAIPAAPVVQPQPRPEPEPLGRIDLSKSLMQTCLSTNCPGYQKTDKGVSVEVLRQHQASSNSGSFVKHTYDPALLKPYHKWRDDLRAWYDARTLPSEIKGLRYRPREGWDGFYAEIGKQLREGERIADQVTEEYDNAKAAAKSSLGSLYRESDYISKGEFRSRFSASFHVQPMPDSRNFMVDLAEGQLEEIKAKLDARMEQLTADIPTQLVSMVVGPVQVLIDKLSKDNSRGTTASVEALVELCTHQIPMLNVTRDQRVTDLCARVVRALSAYDMESVRGEPDTNKVIVEEVKQIVGTL